MGKISIPSALLSEIFIQICYVFFSGTASYSRKQKGVYFFVNSMQVREVSARTRAAYWKIED